MYSVFSEALVSNYLLPVMNFGQIFSTFKIIHAITDGERPTPRQ